MMATTMIALSALKTSISGINDFSHGVIAVSAI
jgi:hypothetical protein